jgi:hypothetical protein
VTRPTISFFWLRTAPPVSSVSPPMSVMYAWGKERIFSSFASRDWNAPPLPRIRVALLPFAAT